MNYCSPPPPPKLLHYRFTLCFFFTFLVIFVFDVIVLSTESLSGRRVLVSRIMIRLDLMSLNPALVTVTLAVMTTGALPPPDHVCRTCCLPTCDTTTSATTVPTKTEDLFYQEHRALWLLICSAIGKLLLTYLLTYG